MKTLVIYHANCWDGFCAAWLLHKAFPDAEVHPAHYGTEPPDVKNKRVFVVDFSYDRSTMFRMGHECDLTVLDHHKTAQAALDGLDIELASNNCGTCEIVFDMSKSGGRLTWEYVWDKLYSRYSEIIGSGETVTRENPPWLVRYTEDRDLWRWAIPDSREITAALRTFPLDFDLWDQMASDPEQWMNRLRDDGVAIRRYELQLIDQHVKHAREIEMDGHKILSVNATVLFSDIAGTLAEGRPFGAAYFDRQDGKRQWSLRSRDDGIDVSEIAKSHGGGGHRNAAGFEEPAIDAAREQT